MSQKLEYDWPPTMRRHRRRRHTEILPPVDPPKRLHVDVTIRHHRQPSWIVPAVVIVAVLLLWRFKLGMLMFAALAGWRMIATFLIVVAILSVIAWRERRVGRPF
jgi:hypothetical protein